MFVRHNNVWVKGLLSDRFLENQCNKLCDSARRTSRVMNSWMAYPKNRSWDSRNKWRARKW